jgi:hypothetical protein
VAKESKKSFDLWEKLNLKEVVHRLAKPLKARICFPVCSSL